jgi:exopolyphosphatase/guanosine-5'-triphosphate,3'-diphosphate pyrophosphatase
MGSTRARRGSAAEVVRGNGASDGGPVLAALDVGTNSFHLVVARVVGGDRFETITREKEVVRLGHGGGDMKELAPDAIERGIACLRRMRRIVESYGATLRAVATSAVREAGNAATFIERARREAGIDVEVISGAEEARLIYLGVLQALPVFDRRLLLVDIGGGSTELLIGEKGETLAARSFKVGAVRLTDRFFPGGDATPKQVTACREYIRGFLSNFEREAEQHGFEVAVASSGTAEAVAHVAHAMRGAEPLHTYNCYELSADDVHAVVAELARHRTASARARVKGLEPQRADIAVAGALILETVATCFGIESFTYSDAALREGVLVDTLERLDAGARQVGIDGMHHLRDVSRRSIRQLAERCDEDPVHSAHVARLAVELFDALQPVHGLGQAAREYLEAGALLANVGLVVAHSKHHLHGYYVIRNSELAGLTDLEIEIIAQIARYHRKSEPKPSHPEFAALDAEHQSLVRTLSGILRVAIGLDRSHRGLVESVRADVHPRRVVIFARPRDGADIGLELYAANERKGLLERVTNRRIELLPG